ncbi:MAG: flagellar hook-length control protein FliK [Rhizobiales bacterium]|nr:flagellar hook-length control protein FliK [Hyphomicrobiales bacterium]
MSEAVQLINVFDGGAQPAGDVARPAQGEASGTAEAKGEALFADLLAAAGLVEGDIANLSDHGAAPPGSNDNQTPEGAVPAAALAALENAALGETAPDHARELENTASALVVAALEDQAGLGEQTAPQETPAPANAASMRAGEALQHIGEAAAPAIAPETTIATGTATTTATGTDDLSEPATDTDGLPAPAAAKPAMPGTAEAQAAETAVLPATVPDAAAAPGDGALEGDAIPVEAPETEMAAQASDDAVAATLAAIDDAALQQNAEPSANAGAVAAAAGPGQTLTPAETAAATVSAATALRAPGRIDGAPSGAPGEAAAQDGAEFSAAAKQNGEAAKPAAGAGNGDLSFAERENAKSTNSAQALLDAAGRATGQPIGERSGPSSALFQTTSETPVFASPPETVQSVVRAALQADNLATLPVRTIAVHIANRLAEGQRAFQIRLDPPELGRIDIRMDIARDGQMTAQLTVDRPETLDALSRDARALERALQAAGLELEEGALEFHLRQQTEEDHATDEDTASRKDGGDAGDEDEQFRSRSVSLNALDIRV